MSALPSDLLPRVIACVQHAGDMLAAEFRRVPGPRGHGDQAEIDLEIELVLRERLLALLGCRFVGEETGSAGEPGARFCWLVDPHDGTSAFLAGHRGSAVSVALLEWTKQPEDRAPGTHGRHDHTWCRSRAPYA